MTTDAGTNPEGGKPAAEADAGKTVNEGIKAAADAKKAESGAKPEKQEAAKAEDGKAKGEEKPAPKATQKAEGPPKEYKLSLPKGSLLSKDDVAEFEKEAKELGLSEDDAKAALELQNEAVAKYVQRSTEVSETWIEESKKDKEIGGDGFEKNVELAKRVVDRFGSSKLKKVLNDSKLGNHPEVLRFCISVGRAMAEDTLVTSAAVASKEPARPEDRLWPNMSKEK
jgi:hypothetical protein